MRRKLKVELKDDPAIQAVCRRYFDAQGQGYWIAWANDKIYTSEYDVVHCAFGRIT